MPPDNTEKMLAESSPKGLYISTWCNIEDQAKELLEKVEKWNIK